MEASRTKQIDNDETQKRIWPSHAIAAVGFSILLLAIFYETTWSMVHTWWRSETFAHGFLIFPISIWLIWDRRRELSQLQPAAEYKVLFALVASGGLWLMGYLVDAQVVEQFALILLLISGIWVLLGNKVAWALSFPLAYLLFAVPAGEDLVPPLMEFTATFTVELLKLTGIPVYREGLFFSLPSGNWSVVEACSGVRYLIASVTLGCLYAYLTYSRTKKRIIFIAFAIVVPIIANGIRAYIIVMLGHLSGMTIATGVDHLIYGWLFFGLVMFVLFAIGAKWRDSEETVVVADLNSTPSSLSPSPYNAGILAIVIAGFWPLLALAMDSQETTVSDVNLTAPESMKSWEITDQNPWQWRPLLLGADKRIDSFYREGESLVLLSVGQYIAQQQGEEMVNTQNLLIRSDDDDWRITGASQIPMDLSVGNVVVEATHLAGPDKRLLVLSWFRVGTSYTANPYMAKFYEATDKLLFSNRGGAKIVVAIESDTEGKIPLEVLHRFINSSLPSLESALDQVTDTTR